MRKASYLLILTLLFGSLAFGQTEEEKEEKKGGGRERDRVKESGQVLKEILKTPDKGIPASILTYQVQTCSGNHPECLLCYF